MTHKLTVGLVLFMCAAATVLAQSPAPQTPHGYTITQEDRDRPNPTPFTQDSIDRGKRLFLSQCAMCHGDNGSGNGEVAQELNANPPDLTKSATLAGRTDGELFAIMSQGSALMPGQGKRMREAHKWDLVNYLRYLGGATPSAKYSRIALGKGGSLGPETPTLQARVPPKVQALAGYSRLNYDSRVCLQARRLATEVRLEPYHSSLPEIRCHKSD